MTVHLSISGQQTYKSSNVCLLPVMYRGDGLTIMHTDIQTSNFYSRIQAWHCWPCTYLELDIREASRRSIFWVVYNGHLTAPTLAPKSRTQFGTYIYPYPISQLWYIQEWQCIAMTMFLSNLSLLELSYEPALLSPICTLHIPYSYTYESDPSEFCIFHNTMK